MTSPEEQLLKRSRLAVEKSLDDLSTHTNRYTGDPATDSPFLHEHQPLRAGTSRKSAARLRLYQNGFLALQHVTISAMDHIRSLRVLLGDDLPPMYAATTLARAAGEATAQVHHRLDAAITPEMRLLRFGASLHHGLEDQVRGAGGLPEDSLARKAGVLESCKAQLAEVRGLFDECGMDIDKTGLTSRVTGETAPFRLQLSGLARDVYPHRPSWYNSASGTAHSQPWALGTANKALEDGHLLFGANMLELGGAVLLALDAAAVLDRTYAAYFGHDPEPAARDYRFRDKAIDGAMAECVSDRLKQEIAAGIRQRHSR